MGGIQIEISWGEGRVDYTEYVCSVVSNSFATPWTVSHQVPLPMEFSRQEYWSELPLPTPGDLPDPEIKPMSFVSSALAGRFFTTSSTWEDPQIYRREGNTGWKRRESFFDDTAKMTQGTVPISLGIFQCFPSPHSLLDRWGRKRGFHGPLPLVIPRPFFNWAPLPSPGSPETDTETKENTIFIQINATAFFLFLNVVLGIRSS